MDSIGKNGRNFGLGKGPFALGKGPFSGPSERLGKPLTLGILMEVIAA